MHDRTEFQTDEPENTNVFRYISKSDYVVYIWRFVSELKSCACMPDANVKDDVKTNNVFRHISAYCLNKL